MLKQEINSVLGDFKEVNTVFMFNEDEEYTLLKCSSSAARLTQRSNDTDVSFGSVQTNANRGKN